jgi:hypothetical protein
MISAFLAICLMSTPIKDCDRETAVSWMKVPTENDLRLPIQCMRTGLLFAAESRLVVQGSYLRVLCVRPQPEKVPQNAG